MHFKLFFLFFIIKIFGKYFYNKQNNFDKKETFLKHQHIVIIFIPTYI